MEFLDTTTAKRLENRPLVLTYTKMKIAPFLILFNLVFYCNFVFGQENQQSPSLKILWESYLGYNFNENKSFQSAHLYNHYHLQKPRINYAQIDWKKEFPDWTVQIGIHDGDYVRRNYSDQPQWAQLISIAQLQYSPKNIKQLKLTAGIFPSHIGFESAWVQNNLTLSRSLLAENSPYFESGFHAQYGAKNGSWNIGVLALTGWQQASLVSPIRKPSWGWSSNFVIKDNIQVSYNGFFGYQNTTGTVKRSYHNFYSNFQKGKWKSILGFDFGQAFINQKSIHWYSPVVIFGKQINESWSSAFRLESMIDPNQFILLDEDQKIIQKSTLGLTVEFKTKNQFFFRLEGKKAFEKIEKTGIDKSTLILLSLSKATSF
jgi:hypothetical protein